MPATPGQLAIAGAADGDRLQCFDGKSEGFGYGGTCVTDSPLHGGSTLLTTTDGDVDGSHAGVYTNEHRLDGRKLVDIKTLSFRYAGSAPTMQSPRFSVPIDKNGNGTFDQWAFVPALQCNDGARLVDVINDTTCSIQMDRGQRFDNWAALVAAYPDARVARNPGVLGLVFVVADEPGRWTIEHVQIGTAIK